MPQPQQCGLWATSVTYTTTHGNIRSLTYWMKPGIEPMSSWMLVGFANGWAMRGTPDSLIFNLSPGSPMQSTSHLRMSFSVQNIIVLILASVCWTLMVPISMLFSVHVLYHLILTPSRLPYRVPPQSQLPSFFTSSLGCQLAVFLLSHFLLLPADYPQPNSPCELCEC